MTIEIKIHCDKYDYRNESKFESAAGMLRTFGGQLLDLPDNYDGGVKNIMDYRGVVVAQMVIKEGKRKK